MFVDAFKFCTAEVVFFNLQSKCMMLKPECVTDSFIFLIQIKTRHILHYGMVKAVTAAVQTDIVIYFRYLKDKQV